MRTASLKFPGRTAMAFAAATASLAGLMVAGAPGASATAAASCYGSSCNGLNPAATTCQNDARTVRTGGFMNIELRYSPSCRAAWGRLHHSRPGDKVYVRNSVGNQSRTFTVPSGQTSVFTTMVNDKDITAWACGQNATGYECTDSY